MDCTYECISVRILIALCVIGRKISSYLKHFYLEVNGVFLEDICNARYNKKKKL